VTRTRWRCGTAPAEASATTVVADGGPTTIISSPPHYWAVHA